jgi:N-acetylneuraminic acid mutarotase
MGGSNTTHQPGNYGTLGIPATGNIPPSRWDAASWTDRNGNFWLFGGSGYAAAINATGVLLNDLWEFDPSTNEWTWMGGSSTLPQSGNGWPGVYGTLGVPAAGNIPGSRYGAAHWVDLNGNLWLFGGAGAPNDLWEYSPSTNEWAWMGGNSVVGINGANPGVYGTLGAPAPGNIPGGRSGALSWTDQSGNSWLFGGSGADANGVGGGLNDLWEFNPSTREWTWIGGNSTVGTNGGWPGVYGTLGTPAAANIPGSRSGAVSWTDPSGNLWLFGGSGDDANGTGTALNDLWKFNPSTNQWAWMGGGTTTAGCTTGGLGLVTCAGQPGVYGVLGTPAAGNVPGGRTEAVSWTDGSGNLWLFGGTGYDSAGNQGNLNDLWKFSPTINEWTWMGGNSTEGGCAFIPAGIIYCEGQAGVYGSLDVPGTGNNPGGRSGASGWIDNKANLWLFSGYGADSTGHGMGTLNDLWEYQP